MFLLSLRETTPPTMLSVLSCTPANFNGTLFCSVLHDDLGSLLFLKIAKIACTQLQIAACEDGGAFISVRSLLTTAAATTAGGNRRPLTALGLWSEKASSHFMLVFTVTWPISSAQSMFSSRQWWVHFYLQCWWNEICYKLFSRNNYISQYNLLLNYIVFWARTPTHLSLIVTLTWQNFTPLDHTTVFSSGKIHILSHRSSIYFCCLSIWSLTNIGSSGCFIPKRVVSDFPSFLQPLH